MYNFKNISKFLVSYLIIFDVTISIHKVWNTTVLFMKTTERIPNRRIVWFVFWNVGVGRSILIAVSKFQYLQ